MTIRFGEYKKRDISFLLNFVANLFLYPMRRKTPCFSYGDIRRVHRIYASN